MTHDPSTAPTYVIKAEDLVALNYLDPDHPLPALIEWINRGTDRPLRRTSIDQLVRTLYHDGGSPSIIALQQSAGLRLSFANETDRDRFATAFMGARAELDVRRDFHVASLFGTLEQAEQVVARLKQAGVPEAAIAMLWRADQIEAERGKGHSIGSVAAATAGGGLAGALLGAGMLLIPGLGLVAAAGAAAAAAIPTVTAVSAALGATGGAMARMLSDQDVDGRDANYYEAQIRRGRVFVSVDTRLAEGKGEVARRILIEGGGKVQSRS